MWTEILNVDCDNCLLFVTAGARCLDQDIERDFPLALDLGCGSGHLYKHLSVDEKMGGIEKLVQCDVAGTRVS